MKRISSAAILAAAITAVAPAAAEDTIKIGAAVGLSGWIVPYDQPALRGVEMAIADINAAGGVLGRQLELVLSDTKADQAQAARSAIELLDGGAEMLIASCDYDFGGPAASEANDRGVVAFSLCAGDHKFGVSGIGPFAYTMTTTAAVEGYAAAEWAASKGWGKAYVLLDDTIQYTKTLCGAFEENAGKVDGLDVAGKDTFKNGDPSISTQITRLQGMSPQPDFIYLCSYAPGAITAIRQLRSAGVDLPILTSGAMDGDSWKDSVANLKDFYYDTWASMYGGNADPRLDKFFVDYKAKYGEEATTSLAIFGYAAIEIWAKAAEKAGTLEGDKVRQTLDGMADEPTLGGLTTFTDKIHYGMIGRDLVMMEIQDWKRTVLGPFRPKNLPQLD
ncbi:MAG: ABC transporter substrate-binding protein [Rhizobiaceae bacterium]